MIIDKTPIIDNVNRTITVEHNIDTSEDCSILINGLVGIHSNDILSIINNTITIKPDIDIDYINDSLSVFYTKLT